MKGLEKFEPDSYFHIVNHAVGSENLFRNDENFRYFMKRYADYMPSVCGTFAYCLMPNHFHFLVKTHSEATLEQHPKYKGDFHKVIIQELSNLLNGYAKAYNNMYDRKGALWIDYTKRFKIEQDSYLTAVINYIHQNPVKHGFVKRAEDWTYSSYQAMILAKPTLLQKTEVIEWFGSVDAFKEFHENETTALNLDWEYEVS